MVGLRLCRSPWEQLRGLIGYALLPPDLGLALPGCAGIHTAFVAAPIDVLFLREGRVLRVAEDVRPWRAVRCPGACATLELAAGSVRRLGLRPGDLLAIEPDGVLPM